ncbi:MAG: DNA-processing protein DprA [Candidatus Margulisbacteria bacterium]|nr:DNA-processing protein DprA [Candidatus Margulisiibacteriota bacterium]
MDYVKPEDPSYPENLTNIHNPPDIYVKGEILEKDKRAVAIVGTRRATNYGLETAYSFAKQLASLGFTIVSGLAEGIDTQAHRGALDAGGRTIAVFGHGLDRVFPPGNLSLAEEILEKGGAWVSEFAPGVHAEKWTFPARNRIISGLSLGTIVVEGGYKSGAMITAKYANDQGREVFAVPGNINLEQSKGPHWLIKQGAKLVESVEDILEEFERILQTRFHFDAPSKEKKDYSGLSEKELGIVKLLGVEEAHIDRISSKAGLPSPEVSSILAMLEIKGFIKQLPGKMFLLR